MAQTYRPTSLAVVTVNIVGLVWLVGWGCDWGKERKERRGQGRKRRIGHEWKRYISKQKKGRGEIKKRRRKESSGGGNINSASITSIIE